MVRIIEGKRSFLCKTQKSGYGSNLIRKATYVYRYSNEKCQAKDWTRKFIQNKAKNLITSYYSSNIYQLLSMIIQYISLASKWKLAHNIRGIFFYAYDILI